MSDFFRFPHTPHLEWLGAGEPRDDKVLTPAEAGALLAGDVLVEEKLDGANIGLSLGGDARLRVQNRGQYLAEPHAGQFARLTPWLAQHANAVAAVLDGDLILFGEWCAARHSLGYDRLPDWFLLFDVYDRARQRFWTSTHRNALAQRAGLKHVDRVASGRFSLAKLKALLATGRSLYRNGPMEGLIIRRESAHECESRAKLVRADFTQAIGDHWRKRAIEWNRVQPAGTPPQ
jgi:hypothetical protein